jgi:hypothetical protein
MGRSEGVVKIIKKCTEVTWGKGEVNCGEEMKVTKVGWSGLEVMVKCECNRSWKYVFHYCYCSVYGMLNILIILIILILFELCSLCVGCLLLFVEFCLLCFVWSWCYFVWCVLCLMLWRTTSYTMAEERCPTDRPRPCLSEPVKLLPPTHSQYLSSVAQTMQTSSEVITFASDKA